MYLFIERGEIFINAENKTFFIGTSLNLLLYN